MTVAELKEYLDQYPDEAEVRFASQPSWPFEYSINEVSGSVVDPPDADEDEHISFDADQCNVVYLVEGRQIGYLPSHVKSEIGW